MTADDTATTAQPIEPAPASAPKPWREWPIDDLGIPKKVVNQLLLAEINTCGDLAAMLEEKTSDFIALGQTTIEKLQEAIYVQQRNADEVPWQDYRLDEFLSIPGILSRKLEQNGYKNWGQVHASLKLWRESETNPLELTDGELADLQGEIDEAAALQAEAEQERHEADAKPEPEAEKPIQATGYQPTAEQLADYDRKTVERIGHQLQVVRAEERSWKSLHAEASSAKKLFEAAQADLNALIEERAMQRLNGRQLTIDDIKPEPADSPSPLPEDLTKDLWQQYPMTFERWERFGLTKSDCEKLNSGETKNHGAHPILVFGDITRFITPNPANPGYARTLKDFKGLGDKGYDRYQEAETKFWAWWNNKGMAEFAAEKGITNGPATIPGTDGPSGGESGSNDASEHVETSTLDTPDLDTPDFDTPDLDEATTDAPKTPKGKRSKRKKQTA